MILVTGRAGYIGSHILVELLNTNHNFVVYDNLCNPSQDNIILDKLFIFVIEY